MRQKYRQKLLKTLNQGPDGQKTTKTKTEGIDNADKKNCPDNFFVRTKGHLPPFRILPRVLVTALSAHYIILFLYA